MKVPYNAPVKRYTFGRSFKIVDPQNRTIFDFTITTGAIDYHKKMNESLDLLVDLMNGVKHIVRDRNSGEYQIMVDEGTNPTEEVAAPVADPEPESAVAKAVNAVKRKYTKRK